MNTAIKRMSAGWLLMLSLSCRVIAQVAPGSLNKPDNLSIVNNVNNADKQQEVAGHLQKAQTYLQENHPDLAIPELRAAATLDPANVEIQANLGVLLYFRNGFVEAIPHLRAALQSLPSPVPPSLAKIEGLLGIAELRTAEIADARKDLESAFSVITDTKFKTQVGLELVGVYAQTGDPADLAQATAILAALRKADPDNAEVLYASYRTYSDLAGASMLALSLTAPDSAQFHQIMAHEESRQGNINGSIAQYRKAIAIDPNLPGVHFELAELLNSSQDANIKKQAEQEYQIALKSNAQDERSMCRLGEIEALRGDSKSAFRDFSKAVALQPADADAKLGLAKVLIEMNQPDKALTILEETVELEPTNGTAHYRLGALYRQKGRVEDAKREIALYQQYKQEKEKLRALYKEMQIQPSEIEAAQPDEK